MLKQSQVQTSKRYIENSEIIDIIQFFETLLASSGHTPTVYGTIYRNFN